MSAAPEGAGDLVDRLDDRGLIAQTTDRESLARELAAGPMTLYAGFDPTAPSLHVGSLLQILLLRRFQRAGHRPIALVGGATGLIGDPRPTAERVLNSPQTVREWGERIRAQLEPFLEFEGPAAARTVDNLDWLGDLRALDLLRDLGKHFRVGRMLAKEAVSARLASDQGISYTEFSYQILQAADYLELYRRYGCRLQTGGSDQWGNLTAGVDLIHRVAGDTVHAVTTPLLTKTDGTKFGKTEGGAVWLDPTMTRPYAFYQFWLRTDDRDVIALLRRCTDVVEEELADLAAATESAPQRRTAQRRLAVEVSTLVHGAAAVAAAQAASEALFGGGDLRSLDRRTLLDAADELPSTVAAPGSAVVDLLAASGLAASKSAARRSTDEGAVHVNNRRIGDVAEVLQPDDFLHGEVVILRRGRRSLAAVLRADASSTR